jgi:citrate synthase
MAAWKALKAAQVSFSIAGATYSLPVHKGTLGPGVLDISTLYQDTDRFTYDPGFASTASCERYSRDGSIS